MSLESSTPTEQLSVLGTKADQRVWVGQPQISWSHPVSLLLAILLKATLLFWFFGRFIPNFILEDRVLSLQNNPKNLGPSY